LFEKADVVSEGAPRGEGSERAYFGSSDIVLPVPSDRNGPTLEDLARAVAKDPHVRVRALRMARREAAQRANGPLDCMRAEITVRPTARGVAVHVDVEARVFPDRRVATRTAIAAGDETLSAGEISSLTGDNRRRVEDRDE
jgi:hypothetical protein